MNNETASLIERLEALEAPCRECDMALETMRTGNRKHPYLKGTNIDDKPNTDRTTYSTPAYTASLDAAMTHAKGKSVRLLITEDGIGSALVDGTEGTAFNAATAIIIASLKAQEASNGR